MDKKLLSKLYSDMLAYDPGEKTFEVILTLHLPEMLNTLVNLVVNKMGGNQGDILKLLVESMIHKQLEEKIREVMSVQEVAPKDNLSQIMPPPTESIKVDSIEGFESAMSQVSQKMEALQGMLGMFNTMASQFQGEKDGNKNGEGKKSSD